jgi:opacity protein-like surface antigen
MRVADYVIVAALATGLSGTALAQEGNQNQEGSPSPQPQAGSPTSPSPAPQTGISTSSSPGGPVRSHWIAAGYAGSAFSVRNADNADPSPNFGGQIGWLWRGVLGGEFMGDFAPSFKFTRLDFAQLFSSKPDVNSYMFNVIAAYPLGSQAQFQPYVSAGIGSVTIRADVLVLNSDLTTNTFKSNQSSFGSDYGGGFLWYVGNVGFRSDVRYIRTSTNNAITTTNVSDFVTQTVLSDLRFWRANAGVAFRW